jgi:hypothetical protein
MEGGQGFGETHRCKAFYKCLKCCVLLLPFVKACIHRVRDDEVDPATVSCAYVTSEIVHAAHIASSVNVLHMY